jgi:hypothetical protein
MRLVHTPPTASRLGRALLVLVAVAAIGGCELVADFDRSKIDAGRRGGDRDGDGGGDQPDASQPESDASQPVPDASQADASSDEDAGL